MPRFRTLFTALLLAALTVPAAATAQTAPTPTATPATSPMPTGSATPMMAMMPTVMDTNCGLGQAAFCDTFDAPSPGGRAGDLNDAAWSFARVTSAVNPVSGMYDWYPPAQAMFCRTPISGVLPERDSFFCDANGAEHMHWMTAINDGGQYVSDSAMIRQPFDFVGRTGTVTFGVDAVTRGPHSWWPSVVITDQPVQDPHGDHPGEDNFPRNGILIDFNRSCAQANDATDDTSTGVGAIEQFTNYQPSFPAYTPSFADPKYCIAVARDTMNRIQVRISQGDVQVWGSDAGTDALKLMADAPVSLGWSRGYVSLEQSHYDAEKFNGADAQDHTYHWHDVGFDGPALPTPRAYEVPDADVPATFGGIAGLNLGYYLNTAPSQAFALPGVDLNGATGALLTFNADNVDLGGAIDYRFNDGTWRRVPEPETQPYGAWVALVGQVPLSDLTSGANTLQFRSAGANPYSPGVSVVANIDLEVGDLAGVASGPEVAPTPVPATPTAAPTAAPTPVPTETASTTSTTSSDTHGATIGVAATVTTTQTVTSTVTQTMTQTVTETQTVTQAASTAFSLACTRSGAAISCEGA